MKRGRAAVLPALALALIAGCGGAVENQDVYVTTGKADSPAPVERTAQRVLADGQQMALEVDIVVENLHYPKRVGLRYAADGGAWTDLEGAYDSPRGSTRELWKVRLLPSAPDWATIEYVVFYEDVPAHQTFWDNNNGKNYHAESLPPVRRTGDRFEDGVLSIELEVKNLDYEKGCSVVLSGDGWVSQQFAEASYRGAAARSGLERWQADLDSRKPEWQLVGRAAVVEYAVSCRFGLGTPSGPPETYWDNNDGQNYRFSRMAVTERARQPFSSAEELAMAPDGTTFVLSSEHGGGESRWITIYTPGGAFKLTRTFSGHVWRMTYVEPAGFLLVGYNQGAEGRWAALTSEGTLRWEAAATLPELSLGAKAAYLVGGAGGALLGPEPPVIEGPTGGCQGMPVVSPQGTLLCRAEGKVTAYLLGQNKTGLSYPDGIPWAALETGEVVLLSSDRRRLTGYDLQGKQRWQRTKVFVAEDSGYGVGDVCPNHASGSVAVFLNQDPAGGSSSDHYLAGLEARTGKEVFRRAESDYAWNPCPRVDGFFYYAPTYMRYGRWTYRVSATGEHERIEYGFHGRPLALLSDGRSLRRVQAYYPGDRARLVASGRDLVEIFSHTYTVAASGARAPLGTMNGSQLVTYFDGQLTWLTFGFPTP